MLGHQWVGLSVRVTGCGYSRLVVLWELIPWSGSLFIGSLVPGESALQVCYLWSCGLKLATGGADSGAP